MAGTGVPFFGFTMRENLILASAGGRVCQFKPRRLRTVFDADIYQPHGKSAGFLLSSLRWLVCVPATMFARNG